MNRENRTVKSYLNNARVIKPNRRRERKNRANDDGSLDVKESNNRQSKYFKKKMSITLHIAGSLIVTAATLLVGFAAYRHATTSEYFSANQFQLKGAHRLSQAEVLKTAGIENGANIFSIDCESAITKLESHPWILKADVRRKLPRNVEIEIVERRVAAAALFDVLYLVDDEGVIFKRWLLGDPAPSPIVTGFTREQFAEDASGVQEIIRDAISLTNRFRALGIERSWPLTEIHHEVDGGFSFTIGQDPFYVRFGKGPYGEKLARLAALLRQVKSEGRRPAMIFFDNEVRPDRVTIRFKENEILDIDQIKGKKNSDDMQKRMSKI